MEMENGVIGLG